MCTLRLTARQFFKAVGVIVRPRALDVRVCSLDQLLFMARQVEPTVTKVAAVAIPAGYGTLMFNLSQKDMGEFVTVTFLDEVSATNFFFTSLSNGKNPAAKPPMGDRPTK